MKVKQNEKRPQDHSESTDRSKKSPNINETVRCIVEKQLESDDYLFKSGCSDGTMVSKVYYNIKTPNPCEFKITRIIEYKRIGPKLNEEQV
jgi:hypothetical protein